MIEDSFIMREYQNIVSFYSESIERKSPSPFHAQIFSGMRRLPEDPHPAGCIRHKLLFTTYNVIPEFCFDCYKIEIQPNTVIELFKLLHIFKSPFFPIDNARKCFLRPRKDIPSHYSGLIYFKGISEARSMLNYIENILSANIGINIPVFVKRGCTDYVGKFPIYAELDKNYEPTLKNNEKWKEIEEQFNKEGLANQLETIPKSPYPDGYGVDDFLSMQTWLSYAKTIGDDSYKKITTSHVDIIPALDPAPYISTS